MRNQFLMLAQDILFFNQNNQWCGCICFGVGATNLAGVPYGLRCGEIIELLRVALNGEQGITSNVVANFY
jgi:hypothetical protein